MIAEEDLFGAEMNLACKLGEDLAEKMEILLTPAAHAALPSGRYAFTRTSFSISGLDLRCHRFKKCLYPRPSDKEKKRTARKASTSMLGKPKGKGFRKG